MYIHSVRIISTTSNPQRASKSSASSMNWLAPEQTCGEHMQVAPAWRIPNSKATEATSLELVSHLLDCSRQPITKICPGLAVTSNAHQARNAHAAHDLSDAMQLWMLLVVLEHGGVPSTLHLQQLNELCCVLLQSHLRHFGPQWLQNQSQQLSSA